MTGRTEETGLAGIPRGGKRMSRRNLFYRETSSSIELVHANTLISEGSRCRKVGVLQQQQQQKKQKRSAAAAAKTAKTAKTARTARTGGARANFM
ncbi:hypothetical protein HZH68_004520 [Vespula germanica]|uniref:Uncharacterized protein n=1 Tax=Vespula germanica TaxID=30212 RepID=A0A834KLH0_VESGE|nr:hypothetical protein HZH68_004520 [Vespula germanica]